MLNARTFDFAVVGAGCFGAWTAHALTKAGHRVLLLDAFGPAHSRASSGGETRVIRMGYGADSLYTRWSTQSLMQWKELSARRRRPLFQQTGMLWLSATDEGYVRQTQRTLRHEGVDHVQMSVVDLHDRFPQIATEGIAWALWEPGSGVLMARQSVQALVDESIDAGLTYRTQSIVPPRADGKMDCLMTHSGERVSAAQYVFACGPWLPKLFPGQLGQRIFPTRQEIFFFAPPPGDTSFGSAHMPAWFHHPDLVYGIPDIENRGFKISIDKHGEPCDPDTLLRLPSVESLQLARAYLGARFPKMKDAALSESRVCQYENTSNGDFIIDRHPESDNVLLVGGGSGHGFKHGPALGDYVCGQLTTSAACEPRFALEAKAIVQRRSVY